MARGVSASGKIWPQYPVLLCCNKSSRGEPRCLLWVVSCRVQQPGLWCGQPLWLSGISFCLFPDLVVDLLAFLVIAHLLCLRRWPSSIAVSGSIKSRSSSHLLPGCRWSGRLFWCYALEKVCIAFALLFSLWFWGSFLKYFFGVTDLVLLLLPP